ncbi:MAG: hypothetical protein KC442_04260 [Thermomicrobiales bacterium]|nr:hypothetical protein [Thermomicrobiales bacterium]
MTEETQESPAEERTKIWDRRADMAIVILLGAASFLAVWAGYQAGQWGTLKTRTAVMVDDLQLSASRSLILGYQDRQVDIALFMAWLEAYKGENATLADFYEARFVDRFRPAFDTWLASDPFDNPDAPLDPFRMPEYSVPALEAAHASETLAGEFADLGNWFEAQADAYVYLTVLLAVVLFFGGIATKISWHLAQAALLVVAWVLFGYCVIHTFDLPNASETYLPVAGVQALEARATPVP